MEKRASLLTATLFVEASIFAFQLLPGNLCMTEHRRHRSFPLATCGVPELPGDRTFADARKRLPSAY